MNKAEPLPKPKLLKVHADTTTIGPAIPPIERIKLFSNEAWEKFILEWADSLQTKYFRVERCGGAGDMGRDIIAYPDENNREVWNNYQCKHYDHPLMPNEVWVEFGKLIYYTYRKDFSYPRYYWFVAPQGAGTALSNLLKKPDKLKQEVINNWDKYCRTKITISKEVVLTVELQAYLNSLDFSIFDYLPPLLLIKQHQSTPYYYARFGGGLPERPESQPPPSIPSSDEINYLRKLFDAYGDHLKREVKNPTDIENEEDLKGHYTDSRLEFYSAEALRSFSRDTLPEGAYEELQEEVYDGVRDVIRDEHEDGYQRVKAVVKTAKSLQLTSHALVPRIVVRDRGGICHQLANEKDELRWVKK